MKYNLAKFFASVRASKLFGNSLSVSQVVGMEAIINAAPSAFIPEELAYCLATTKHETADTMMPIKEYGGDAYYTKMYDILGSRPAKARELGNLSPGDGKRYPGKGFVQLTGRANYKKAGDRLGIDLVNNPDRAMEPDIAAKIMFAGMTEGWFTGKKLSDYFAPGKKPDPMAARKIINGTDKASLIAVYYDKFLAALEAAKLAQEPVSLPIAPEVALEPTKPADALDTPTAASYEPPPALAQWILAQIAAYFSKKG